MKITLADILGSFASVVGLNSRFQQIEDELNNKVLYRDNPIGEDNVMKSDLDMDGNDLINTGSLVVDDFTTQTLTITGLLTAGSAEVTGNLNASSITAVTITQDGEQVIDTITPLSGLVTVVDLGGGEIGLDTSAAGGGDVFLAGTQSFTGVNDFAATSTFNGVVNTNGNNTHTGTNDFTDVVTLSEAPTLANHSTRKDYVDTVVAAVQASVTALSLRTVFSGRVDDAGVAVNLPAGWSSARLSEGLYRVTHPSMSLNTVCQCEQDGILRVTGSITAQTLTSFDLSTFRTNSWDDEDRAFNFLSQPSN